MKGNVIFLLLLWVVFVVPMPVCPGAQFERYRLSLPDLGVQETERIDSFTVTISYGDVISLTKIPASWSIHVDNAPPWRTTVSGSISIGAAALTRQEMGFFKHFLVIQRKDKGWPVLVEATVASFFEKNLSRRTREFKHADINLQPIGQ
jgi:hypothetical protein